MATERAKAAGRICFSVLGVFCSAHYGSTLRLAHQSKVEVPSTRNTGQIGDTTGWSLTNETVRVCSFYDGIKRDLCLSTFGAMKTTAMSAYKKQRSTCSWQTFPGNFSHSVFEPNAQAYVDRTSTVTVTACEKETHHDEKMFIYKIGPFRSHGDMRKWHRFGIEGILADYVGKGLGLRSFLQAPVNEEGGVLGRPPIHIHHNHFTDQQCNTYSELFNLTEHSFNLDDIKHLVYSGHHGYPMWADTHGDRQCIKAMGGVDCLIRTYPDGWAQKMRISKSGCMVADYVDIRPASSPLLLWWVENMVTITEKTQHTMGLFAFAHGHFRQVLGRILPTSEYNVDARNETILWSSNTVEHDGTALQVILHVHRALTEDAWLVRGKPSDIGLDEMSLCNPATLDQWNLSPYFDLHRQNLIWRISSLEKEGKAEMLCNISRQSDPWEMVDGVAYERMQPLRCAGFTFKKGEVFTIVSFHRVQPSFEHMRMEDPVIGMHTSFYIYNSPANITGDIYSVVNNLDGLSDVPKDTYIKGGFASLLSANNPMVNSKANSR